MNFIRKTSVIAFILFFTVGTTSIYAQEFDPTELLEQRNIQPISDGELKTFASVYQKLAQINQEGQQKMVSIIEQNGMDLERYNEIQMAAMQNEDPNINEKEEKQVSKISEEFTKVQPEIQAELESKVTEVGLTIERVNDIILAVQEDKALREKLQLLMTQE